MDKPCALDVLEKAEQFQRVLAHMRLDMQHHGLAWLKPGQRARPCTDQIADTVDVNDRFVRTDRLDMALEHSDHAALPIPAARL